MKKFSVKLLFQFRIHRQKSLRRRVEIRIVTFQAKSFEAAIATANAKGHGAQFTYKNTTNQNVKFQYVGIMDIIQLGVEIDDPDTTWYDVKWLVQPSERKRVLVLSKRELQKLSKIS